ncbi:LysM peptidoglycan-binding domain-containing protein [Elusimicrobiota bacterium]
MQTWKVLAILMPYALCLVPLSSHASTFEDITAGARTTRLGQSYIGSAQGHQSLYTNPAGLASITEESVASGLAHYYTQPYSTYHFSYMRPVFRGITAGSGWQAARSQQQNIDRFYVGWAQTDKFPMKMFEENPFSWGVDAHVVHQRKRPGLGSIYSSKLGAGVGAGALLSFPKVKVDIGASLTNIESSNLDLHGPFLCLGASKRIKQFKVMMDYRARQGNATIYPAIEMSLFHDIARMSIGRGFRFGQLKTVAFGFGFNLTPVEFDFAFQLPMKGLHRSEGSASLSFAYSFGRTRFYEEFVGKAAEESQRISGELNSLKVKKRQTKDDLLKAERDLGTLRNEIKALESRQREVMSEIELKALDKKAKARARAEREARKKRPPKPAWPKRHRVSMGDTLRKIATKYYGDPNLWDIIYKSNPEKIERGLPKVGEILTIPNPK